MNNRRRRKQIWNGALAALLLTGLLSGCSGREEKAGITAAEQLNDGAYTIGVPTGAAAEAAVAQDLPKAQVVHFDRDADAYLSVQQGKIDAFAYDRVMLEFAVANGLEGVKLLPEAIGETMEIAIGLSPKSAVPDLEAKVNQFLDELRDSGTLDDMRRRWVEEAEDTIPDIPVPTDPALTLKVGTTGLVQPFSYYKGDQLCGYDIEMIRRFAAWMNADVEIKVYDYGGIVAAAESGAVDCIMANLNATEERRQSIPFSQTIYDSHTAVMVRDDGAAVPYAPLERANYGVMTGSTAEAFLTRTYPQAGISTFSAIADAFLALDGGKVDYVLTAYTTALNAVRGNPNLKIYQKDVIEEESSIAVSKSNPELRSAIDRVLDGFKADGTLEKVVANWTTEGADYVIEELPRSDGANGVLRVAIAADREPMCFVMDGAYRGLDCELIERIAYELGMTVEYQNMQFGSLVAALASGKADVIISNMTATAERRESVDFTQSYFANPQVLVTRSGTAQGGEGFLERLKASFTRTFITEGRWKLILSGLWITVLISICSGILGTVLGFGLCMLRRSRRRSVGGLTAAFIRIIQGTPIVVLLMLLYYVVFGSIDIPAVLVSVLGFAVNFAVYVSEMMRTGIDAVDPGQLEAATALGYNRFQVFRKVTFPQAARHFLPVFKGEFISMVKMTSVVGYIAVQDLTKVSDIIRSRTLEAFFPLIATAVLYFIIANILTLVLSLVEVRLDPKRRPRRVKGVTEL